LLFRELTFRPAFRNDAIGLRRAVH